MLSRTLKSRVTERLFYNSNNDWSRYFLVFKIINKLEDDTCWLLKNKHCETYYVSLKFVDERNYMNRVCGVDVTKENIAELLLNCRENYKIITETVKAIMKIKEQMEKKRKILVMISRLPLLLLINKGIIVTS